LQERVEENAEIIAVGAASFAAGIIPDDEPSCHSKTKRIGEAMLRDQRTSKARRIPELGLSVAAGRAVMSKRTF
jgi:hypothetical protein